MTDRTDGSEGPGQYNVNYEMEVYQGRKEDGKNDEIVPESDGVNLQCINSSDFVVGKQTTFNGPVTIINYTESAAEKIDEIYKPSKEEIILREKVITPATVSEIKAFAEKKTEDSKPEENSSFIRRIFRAKFLKIPIVLWILLVIVVTIGSLAYSFGNEERSLNVGEGKGPQRDPKKPWTIKYNGKEHRFVAREDWNARPPLSTVELKLPVPYVVISHSASRFCYLQPVCKTLVRDIQGYHMNHVPTPFADITYNFMVGGDGNIYEGRGWKSKSTSVGFANARSLNFNFLGSFENLDAPTYPQTEGMKALIEYGLNNSYIDQNYSLVADNATYATLSPGVQVYREIKNWPHFDPNPKEHANE